MFNSAILDVAIGMIFVYLLLSLLCSAANELIELVLKKRAKNLEAGLTELLENPADAKALVSRIYSHPLINCLFEGPFKSGGRKLPSYIPATSFALALMDLVPRISSNAAAGGTNVSGAGAANDAAGGAASVAHNKADVPALSGAANATASPTKTASPQVVVNVRGGAAAADEPATETAAPAAAVAPDPVQGLRDALQDFPFTKVRDALVPLVDAAGQDAAKARQNIEEWFNSSMDRISGWYKRRAQVAIFVIGMVVAVWLNADTIRIVKALSSDKDLRAVLVAQAEAYATENAKSAGGGGGNTNRGSNAGADTADRAANTNAGNSAQPANTNTANTTNRSANANTANTNRSANTNTANTNTANTNTANTNTANSNTANTNAAGSASPPANDNTQAKSDAKPTTTSECAKPECDKDPESPQCKLKRSKCEIQALGLPIGWTPEDTEPYRMVFTSQTATGHPYLRIFENILGWLLTALAVSLGAPFWFDMLNKFIVVRSTVKPKEKSGIEPSKA